MEYLKALEIIEKEFETIYESSHNKIVRTGLTYDGCRGFCVSIYDKEGEALLTDLGITKDVFDEVEKEEWESLCKEHNFEFAHWSITRKFTCIEDLYEYIRFLDFCSDKFYK